MVPVVLYTASAVTVRAFRSLNGVVPGLRGDDLLLNTRQQPLRFGQGQTQISDVAEVIGPVDLHDVRARPLALTPNFHQPQHPGHASTLGQRTDAKIPHWPSHPQSCGSPVHPVMDGRGQRRIIAGHRTTPAPANSQTPRNGTPPGRSGEVVALRPLAFYDAVGKRLAADGAAA